MENETENFKNAIDFGIENGNLEIVTLLLQDERVDPSADNNYGILNEI